LTLIEGLRKEQLLPFATTRPQSGVGGSDLLAVGMVPAATVGARIPCRAGLESTAGKLKEFLTPTKHMLPTGPSAWPASTRWAIVNMHDCALHNG